MRTRRSYNEKTSRTQAKGRRGLGRCVERKRWQKSRRSTTTTTTQKSNRKQSRKCDGCRMYWLNQKREEGEMKEERRKEDQVFVLYPCLSYSSFPRTKLLLDRHFPLPWRQWLSNSHPRSFTMLARPCSAANKFNSREKWKARKKISCVETCNIQLEQKLHAHIAWTHHVEAKLEERRRLQGGIKWKTISE